VRTFTERRQGSGGIGLGTNDSSDCTIIGELADPSCVTAARFKQEITSVRPLLLSQYPHGRLPAAAGQSGVAPNGIELHLVSAWDFPSAMPARGGWQRLGTYDLSRDPLLRRSIRAPTTLTVNHASSMGGSALERAPCAHTVSWSRYASKYLEHLEAKSSSPDGGPGRPWTTGRLSRSHLLSHETSLIGKERTD
jgi:hypothetical protein